MEEVAVINCVAVLSINVEQVAPDVLAESALILVQHERRLRNQFQVYFDFVQEDFVVLNRSIVGAIWRLLWICKHLSNFVKFLINNQSVGLD